MNVIIKKKTNCFVLDRSRRQLKTIKIVKMIPSPFFELDKIIQDDIVKESVSCKILLILRSEYFV